MSRQRYTDEDKARWLAEFAITGGNAAAFCRERGLGYQSFMHWRRAAAEPPQAPPAPGFIEIDLAPRREATPVGGTLVELDFGGGLVLRIRPLHGQALPRL
jgi:hypothetical protein